MTLEELRTMGDQASLNIAARPAYLHTGHRLEPRLWEALRVEMQRRLRRATGEPDAIVTFTFNGEASLGIDT